MSGQERGAVVADEAASLADRHGAGDVKHFGIGHRRQRVTGMIGFVDGVVVATLVPLPVTWMRKGSASKRCSGAWSIARWAPASWRRSVIRAAAASRPRSDRPDPTLGRFNASRPKYRR